MIRRVTIKKTKSHPSFFKYENVWVITCDCCKENKSFETSSDNYHEYPAPKGFVNCYRLVPGGNPGDGRAFVQSQLCNDCAVIKDILE